MAPATPLESVAETAAHALASYVMRVAMMTREYPPEVYGGAGVHVTELVRHLRASATVDVHCMGAPRDTAHVYTADPGSRAPTPP